MAVVQDIFPLMLTMSRVAMAGVRRFHSSATRLWKKTEPSLRDTLSQKAGPPKEIKYSV